MVAGAQMLQKRPQEIMEKGWQTAINRMGPMKFRTTVVNTTCKFVDAMHALLPCCVMQIMKRRLSYAIEKTLTTFHSHAASASLNIRQNTQRKCSR